MERAILASLIIVCLLSATSALIIKQANSSETTYIDETYGGVDYDEAWFLVQTVDGGYALVGNTFSFGAGASDFWLVKTDASGNHEWNQTYGGPNDDYARSLMQTVDGGYVLVGYTSSFGAGSSDFWLVKTDVSGNHEWNHTYGGMENDRATSVVQTVDGGYALVGDTRSFGAGSSDFWLVKTDVSGNHEWNHTYGGTTVDSSPSLVNSVDGGYALLGFTNSFGKGGGMNFWLVKTDASGNHEWNQTYVRTSMEAYPSSVVQTMDGGYALAGMTESYFSYSDFWLVKTDVSGNHEWNYTYGGLDVEGALSLVQTVDGGYALAGGTNPYGAFSSSDILFVKTDASGSHEWNKTYGGPNADFARSVVQTVDGGYALAGYTRSFGAGDVDFWLVKTDEFGIIPEFPAWTLFLAVIVFTVTIIFYRRKLLKITNH
ncbi:MAG: hypothetical protein NWF11_02245 [Candidatus Bathyarchaeota archaeon]|nr:hypothetical protein [Candidatus Bathyarchaeota archaeon]